MNEERTVLNNLQRRLKGGTASSCDQGGIGAEKLGDSSEFSQYVAGTELGAVCTVNEVSVVPALERSRARQRDTSPIVSGYKPR